MNAINLGSNWTFGANTTATLPDEARPLPPKTVGADWWERTGCPPIETIIDELIAAKLRANRRPLYVEELKRCLGKFAEFAEAFTDQNLRSIGPADLERFLSRFDSSLSTRKTMLLRVSTLFSFAERRGYLEHNPIKRMEWPIIDKKPPRILSPAEVGDLMEVVRNCDPPMLPYVIIGLYVGCRPTEILRLKWSDINLKAGIITIDAAASKVRRRRIVPIDPKAVQLLGALDRTGRLFPATRVPWHLNRIGHWMGWKSWEQNILRRTAASYLLAKHKDAGKVALWLGNSPDVLLAYYHELVQPDECAAFWSLEPAP